jgi:hypothetical protein
MRNKITRFEGHFVQAHSLLFRPLEAPTHYHFMHAQVASDLPLAIPILPIGYCNQVVSHPVMPAIDGLGVRAIELSHIS